MQTYQKCWNCQAPLVDHEESCAFCYKPRTLPKINNQGATGRLLFCTIITLLVSTWQTWQLIEGLSVIIPQGHVGLTEDGRVIEEGRHIRLPGEPAPRIVKRDVIPRRHPLGVSSDGADAIVVQQWNAHRIQEIERKEPTDDEKSVGEARSRRLGIERRGPTDDEKAVGEARSRRLGMNPP